MKKVGIDIGGTQLRCAIFDEDNQILVKHKIPNNPNLSARENLDLLIDFIQSQPYQYEGIGIGCPGPLNIRLGKILNPPNLKGWNNFEIVSYVESKTGLKTFLNNDANVAGLAEAVLGGGKLALAGGFAGGVLASQGQSGFLGALLAGFIAGFIVKFLEQKGLNFLSENLLLIPLLSVIVIGLSSFFIIEPIVGQLNQAMSSFLNSLSDSNKIILGLIVGGMQATDMGGPINKTAYLFATASLVNGQYDIMAAVLAGGIVPPYVTAFASTIFKNKFTQKERQTGMTNYIIGLAGITESAIPFLTNDPVRVIFSCVIGASIAGALSMFFSCSVIAPFWRCIYLSSK